MSSDFWYRQGLDGDNPRPEPDPDAELEEWRERLSADDPGHRIPCADPSCVLCRLTQLQARGFDMRWKPRPQEPGKQRGLERAVRAEKERQHRRGAPDERVARTKAATATGGERLWNLFAEKRGGPFHDSGEELQPGHLKYEVWADTKKNARFLAKRGAFATSSTARGVRSITSGKDVELAPYLNKRQG